MLLGGNREGTRLARNWKESVPLDDIPVLLGGLFSRYAKERRAGQGFGDWTDATKDIWETAAA